MKRREVLKQLTTVAGTLLPSPAWSLLKQQPAQKADLTHATPIR
jgi:hypothetical protein